MAKTNIAFVPVTVMNLTLRDCNISTLSSSFMRELDPIPGLVVESIHTEYVDGTYSALKECTCLTTLSRFSGVVAQHEQIGIAIHPGQRDQGLQRNQRSVRADSRVYSVYQYEWIPMELYRQQVHT